MKEYSSGLYGSVFSSALYRGGRRKTRPRCRSRSKTIGAGAIRSINPGSNRAISCHRQRTSRHIDGHNETDTIWRKGSRRQRRMSRRSRKRAGDRELGRSAEMSDTGMTETSHLEDPPYPFLPLPANEPSLNNHSYTQLTQPRRLPSITENTRVNLDKPLQQKCSPFRSQWAATLYLSLATFNVGYSMAFHSLKGTSLALPDSNNTPLLTTSTPSANWQLFWLENLFSFGGCLGAVLAGLSLRYSRRRIFVLAGFSLSCAWLMAIMPYVTSNATASRSPTVIYGARLMAGLSAGLVMVVTPVYLSESVGPQRRGSLSVLPISASFLGSISCFAASSMWFCSSTYCLAAVGASFLAPYLLLVILRLPESPRYLLHVNQPACAYLTLRQLRGKTVAFQTTKDELDAMQKFYDSSTFPQSTWFERPFWRPVLLCSGLMFFSQFSGIDTVLLYAWHRSFLITEPKLGKDNWSLITLYCVQFVASLVAAWNVDKRGRKLLLLLSTATAAAAVALLGLVALLEDLAYWDSSNWALIEWIPILCLISFAAAHAFGLGTVPWVMLGELLPLRHPGWAVTVATTFYWVASVVLTVSLPTLRNMLYTSGTFWFYSIFCVSGYLFVLFCVPDMVRQATLEDIRRFFMKRSATDPPNKEDLWTDNVNVC